LAKERCGGQAGSGKFAFHGQSQTYLPPIIFPYHHDLKPWQLYEPLPHKLMKIKVSMIIAEGE